MRDLKIIREDTLHETIAAYIKAGEHIIADIDEMKSLVCKMIKEGHMFAMDRDRLRDAIEDFVYFCQPDDELNEDRLMKSLEYDDDETDDEFEESSPRTPHRPTTTRHSECKERCQKLSVAGVEAVVEDVEAVVEDVATIIGDVATTIKDVATTVKDVEAAE